MSCDAEAVWAAVVMLLLMALLAPVLPTNVAPKQKEPKRRGVVLTKSRIATERADPFYGYKVYKSKMDKALFFKDVYGIEAAWKDWSWAARNDAQAQQMASLYRDGAIRKLQQDAETTDENGYP